MKVCEKSMSSFDALFRIFDVTLDIEDMDDFLKTIQYYQGTVFLTVKYWSKDHAVRFMENHFDKVMSFAAYLYHRSKLAGDSPKSQAAWMCFSFLPMLWIKLKQFGLRRSISSLPPMTKDETHKSMLLCRTVRAGLKQVVLCSSKQCDKWQKDSENQFKLCGGCKLTYYCCRSCQKRAWPQHKSNCMTLRRLYC